MPISHQQYGNGDTLIIALAGYKQNPTVFEPIIEHTQTAMQWAVLSLPLITPHCTRTEIPKPQEIIQYIQQLIQIHKPKTVHLLGFSFGGRLVQHLFGLQPELFETLILINSDGIRNYPLQWLVKQTWVSERVLLKLTSLFSLTPKRVQFLANLGLIRKKMVPFAQRFTQNKAKQQEVLRIWKQYATYQPAKKILSQYASKIHLIWSKNDEAVPLKYAQHWQKKHPKSRLYEISGTHYVLKTGAQEIAAILLKQIVLQDIT